MSYSTEVLASCASAHAYAGEGSGALTLGVCACWPGASGGGEGCRADVEYLATVVPLDAAVLRERYNSEMRAYLGVPEREDLTLDLWIEIIQQTQRRR